MTVQQLSELIYTAVAGSLNDFVHPDYVADDGGGTTYFTATLKVEVNGVLKTLTTDYTLPGGGIVRFNSDLTAGDVVRIWRDSVPTAARVDFPSVTKLNAEEHLNKNTYHLLWLVQELMSWVYSCLRWAYSSAHAEIIFDAGSKIVGNLKDPEEDQDAATKASAQAQVDASAATLSAAISAAQTAAQAYALGLFSSLSISGALTLTTYTGSVSDGDTYFDVAGVPNGTFTKGIVVVGGNIYDIATDTTLSSDGAGGTRITFTSGAVVGDHDVIVLAGEP